MSDFQETAPNNAEIKGLRAVLSNLRSRRGSRTAYIASYVDGHRSKILSGSTPLSYEESARMIKRSKLGEHVEDSTKALRIVGIEGFPCVEYVEQAVRSELSKQNFERSSNGAEVEFEMVHTNPGFVIDWLTPGGDLMVMIIELAKQQRDFLAERHRLPNDIAQTAIFHTFDGYEDRAYPLWDLFRHDSCLRKESS